MTAIRYRYYERGDEKRIVKLWNECLRLDPITDLRFRNLVLLDANFDPEGLRLAFDGERLVGCMYGVRRRLPMLGTDLEPENGWIPFFFVAPEARRRRIAANLLQDVFAFLAKHGRTTVFFASYAPHYILPGLDEDAYPEAGAFLRKHGFRKRYSPVAMNIPLVGYAIPEDVEQLKRQRMEEGYTFEPAEDGDLYEVIQFATHVMENADWGRAIREGVRQGLPLTSLHLARDHGRLVGFCMHGGYEGIRERFGPFGVDPEQQGRGLGKILLYDLLASMRAQGMHGAWFLWTGETTPAGYLYKRAGFRVTRTFQVMARPVEEPAASDTSSESSSETKAE
ncbi:hypothetical protein J31TS4_17950 [Paenibacillus sp. J31TS4]|uniref:GNAT family N-acetyltransferase n=1 Tax=Paenibacillus sp. J31TS4 TaxID=2807195 RepID=UPI001B236874|nr:GNAT family N-acetyltransferase [Paenibacillus sp. J31TS4]GIP38515.1 hypothetical protein J31TS4_17950 [Paenibacillus sp. J31TS4]